MSNKLFIASLTDLVSLVNQFLCQCITAKADKKTNKFTYNLSFKFDTENTTNPDITPTELFTPEILYFMIQFSSFS